MICNKDCEHCPYPDCINDEMDFDDFKASDFRDRLLKVASEPRKSPKKKQSYYERNRDKQIAAAKAWAKNHPERTRISRARYYAANRDRVIARQKEYDRTHPRYAGRSDAQIQHGRCITYARVKSHLSRDDLAALIGSSVHQLTRYEQGLVKNIPWERLTKFVPMLNEIKDLRCSDFCEKSGECDRSKCYFSYQAHRRRFKKVYYSTSTHCEKEKPPADVPDRQAEGVSTHLPHDNK